MSQFPTRQRTDQLRAPVSRGEFKWQNSIGLNNVSGEEIRLADNGTTRRLATIIALDVAGYSARTEADEAGATAGVARLRGAIEAIAAAHSGRVFNTAGDGFMLEIWGQSRFPDRKPTLTPH